MSSDEWILRLASECDALKKRVAELEAQVPKWIPTEKLGEYLIAWPHRTAVVFLKPPASDRPAPPPPAPPPPKEVK